MTTSRLGSTTPLQVEVNGYQLEEAVIFKYLGAWISSDLSWTKHIEITCSKAKWVLGYCTEHLHRIVNLTPSFLYTNPRQVLPILDYASVVWEPHLKKDKLLLVAVQRQATRMASRQGKENSASLNQIFKLPTLECRRKYYYYLQVFKWVYLLSHRLFCTAS